MKPLRLQFYGPYSWIAQEDAPSIFETELGKKAGVYLWTIAVDNTDLIYYVGQTQRSFTARMLEHFKEHASGGYHLYKPEDFVIGVKTVVWPGRYDVERKTTVEEFLQSYHSLWKCIKDLARLYRFWVAPLDGQRRLVERIEAAISDCLYKQSGLIGEFQDKGIRYRPRRHDEEPVEVSIEANKKIAGLPHDLWV